MALAATALMSSACAGTHAAVKKDSAPAAPKSAAPATLANPALTEAARTADAEPDVRDANVRSVAELKEVHFPYDSDRLDDGERAILRTNADWLKAHESMKVQIAGNCDQRGTVAYNLALGQRRAEAVRQYYASLGVSKDRVATISYGKERLLCAEMVEDCWSRNRRAETLEVVEAKVAAP
jgi:peptidoglycan-associated lipoprotein